MEVRGVDLLVDVRGTVDPVVVWGHGLTSSMAAEDETGLFDWSLLTDRARVVRYDARGHGASGSTVDLEGYHWRELAADQLALVDALAIDRYVAGGASMGCATALHAAVSSPDRIVALVLAIPPTAWATRAAQAGVYLEMADLVERGRLDELLAGVDAMPAPDPFVDDPTYRERFARTLRATDPVRLARIFRGAAGADLPEPRRIAAIHVPTLILAWTGDDGHPVSTAARLQELVAGAELVVATTADGVAQWPGRIVEFLDALGG